MVFDIPSILHEMPSEEHLRGVYGEHWPIASRIAWLTVLRTAASEAQNHRCCYCGIRTAHDGPQADSPTLEHVVPRVRGGRDERDNCVMACGLCNQSRGDSRIAEEAFLDGGGCDEPTHVERWVSGRGAIARRRRMRVDMRTAAGWAAPDVEVAARHDVSVDEVSKFRRHRTFVLSVLAGQDGFCPACGWEVPDDGSMIAVADGGVGGFEVVHHACYQDYRRWLADRGRLGEGSLIRPGDREGAA